MEQRFFTFKMEQRFFTFKISKENISERITREVKAATVWEAWQKIVMGMHVQKDNDVESIELVAIL